MDLTVSFDFDNDTFRHRMNGTESVLHCHHYLCLTTRTAIKYKHIGGVDILKASAEDAMYPLLKDYVEEKGISDPKARLKVGAEYYALMGLGRMEAAFTQGGGMATLQRSHIDQGWISKWGRTDKHVNYFTCGYVAGMFAVATGRPRGSYDVREKESIVSGSSVSRFHVSNRLA